MYEAARLHAIACKCSVVPKPWVQREVPFKTQFSRLIKDLCSGEKEFEDFEVEHNSWMKVYFKMGWRRGKVYDPKNKIHLDLVPYKDLDPREKAKDKVFVSLVEIAKNCIW